CAGAKDGPGGEEEGGIFICLGIVSSASLWEIWSVRSGNQTDLMMGASVSGLNCYLDRRSLQKEALAFMDGMSSDGGPATVPPLAQWRNDFARVFRYYLDRSTPHTVERWLGTLVAAAIYILRAYYVQGFYIVSYGLGIYVLNLLIGFMSPKVDPELEALDGASLPTRGSDEFRPFVRRLPEFKFWYSTTKAFIVAFIMTFISLFDVPVFWPILLCYWIVLFVLTMKRQIMHMIKYKYVPFSFGKQKYTRSGPSVRTSGLRRD
ncbi:Retrieval of early ER protein Rer1, partial [Dillenia turbinata]